MSKLSNHKEHEEIPALRRKDGENSDISEFYLIMILT